MGHARGSDSTVATSFFKGALAGWFDWLIFHPLETVSTRLRTNQLPRPSLNQLWPYYKHVIFKDVPPQSSYGTYLRNLYSGAGWALIHKTSTRGYRFGTLFYLEGILKQRYRPTLEQHVDKRYVDPIITTTAATLTGVSEVAFTPLDTLVIRYQNGERRQVVEIIKREGLHLYRGWNWLTARNGLGSFFLFSIPECEKAWLAKDTNPAFAWQAGFANLAGSITAVVSTNFLDVVKTRLQTQEIKTSRREVFRQMWREEGISACMKGTLSGTLLVASRLALIKMNVEYLLPAMWAYLTKDESRDKQSPDEPITRVRP